MSDIEHPHQWRDSFARRGRSCFTCLGSLGKYNKIYVLTVSIGS